MKKVSIEGTSLPVDENEEDINKDDGELNPSINNLHSIG